MAKKKKGRGNPILDACDEILAESETLSRQKRAQYTIAHTAKKNAEQLDYQIRLREPEICKEIADEILSRDLQLSETEYALLTMKIVTKKGSKKPPPTLLEELIRRKRHNVYPSIEEYVLVARAKVHKVVGDDVVLRDFFKMLNRKCEGLLKFTLKRRFFHESYLKTLKKSPIDKVAIELEFIIQNS